MPLFDRKSRICLRAVCVIVNPNRELCRQPTIRHSPQVASFLRRDSTFLRQYATVLRHDATLLRRDATVLRTFAPLAKVDLRRIAFDFLTVRIRVSDARSATNGFGVKVHLWNSLRGILIDVRLETLVESGDMAFVLSARRDRLSRRNRMTSSAKEGFRVGVAVRPEDQRHRLRCQPATEGLRVGPACRVDRSDQPTGLRGR